MIFSKYKTKDGKEHLAITFNKSELQQCKSANHLRATYSKEYEIHLDAKTKIKVCDIINFDKLKCNN